MKTILIKIISLFTIGLLSLGVPVGLLSADFDNQLIPEGVVNVTSSVDLS